ncbi:MAG TPA: metal-sensitive transcriptional regulator [Terriglobales bacterium]|nr:metal-sensitive transcriptional regulator [Terriglobales bacterium]
MPKRSQRRLADSLDAPLQRALLARLRRAEGQVRGLARMVEERRYCPDVLTQISAVHESLRGVARLLMRNHLEHCATNALRSGDPARAQEVYAELTDLFYKHAR